MYKTISFSRTKLTFAATFNADKRYNVTAWTYGRVTQKNYGV